MKNSRLLVIVVLLQGLILAGQWFGGASAVSPAMAQIPDSGAQLNRVIDELKGVNARLEKLIGLMESGKLQVRVVSPDEKK